MKEKYQTKNLLLKLKKKDTLLPEDLFECDHFESLEIISENLEEIDPKIKNLNKLKTLSLNAKALKSVPKEVFEIETLKILKIKNSQVDHLEKEIDLKCLGLETLILNNNKLTDLPQWLGKFENLVTLDLAKNDLSKLPDSFNKLQKLKRLNMDSNSFKDVPGPLKELNNIGHISLDNNPLTEEAKNELFQIFKIWF